jgi:hypothetical protein
MSGARFGTGVANGRGGFPMTEVIRTGLAYDFIATGDIIDMG